MQNHEAEKLKRYANTNCGERAVGSVPYALLAQRRVENALWRIIDIPLRNVIEHLNKILVYGDKLY